MKSLIVANWKMNPQTLKEAERIFNSVRRGFKNTKRVEVVICPPFLYISSLKSSQKRKSLHGSRQVSNLKLGAQDCFFEERGSFTGEISPAQLEDLGCQYVILGHSERRRYLKETDEIINKKIKKCLEFKLNPILCIGESLEERENGQTINILQTQIKEGLREITKKEMQTVVIAYEPIWAIGSGNACSVDEAQSIGLLIKKIVAQLYGRTVFKNLRVLYGGSVDSENAANYIKEARLDGLLVGGASLKSEEFLEIIRNSGKSS